MRGVLRGSDFSVLWTWPGPAQKEQLCHQGGQVARKHITRPEPAPHPTAVTPAAGPLLPSSLARELSQLSLVGQGSSVPAVPVLPHIYQYFLFLINMSYIFIIGQVKHFPKNSRSAPLFFPSRITNTTWGREKYRKISVISPVEQSGPKFLCQVPVCLCHALA